MDITIYNKDSETTVSLGNRKFREMMLGKSLLLKNYKNYNWYQVIFFTRYQGKFIA
jgi:NOL1/NOP2/fmu family ribosome biogenesis protein